MRSNPQEVADQYISDGYKCKNKRRPEMASFFYAPPLGFIYEKYFLHSSNIKQTAVKIRLDQTIQF